MRQLTAFTRKEFTEIRRSKKGLVVFVIFVIFGIMSPAMAKLTPWLYETLAESLKEQGISIGNVTVTALTSWEQYYKNMFMEFLVLAVVFGGILTSEYQKGTLINILTKGLNRWKVIAAKCIALFISWTVCYWLCFGITCAYTAYFWDNGALRHILLSAAGSYLFGIWLIAVIMLFSTLFNSVTTVLLATGVLYMVLGFLSMIPAAADYLPLKMTSGLDLLTGKAAVQDYAASAVVTAAFTVIAVAVSVRVFNRKRL
ncbi:MAG: ABC transporter permease subunit [Eubacteriales bacterium]|nr:ABC transporter permease subunit [Eubacteriales bacterium]